MKNTGCVGCHQLGQQSTRTIPPSLGTFATGADAWKRRVQSGQSGAMMLNQLNNLGERVVRQLRRLDRPHRQGRAAVCHPAPPAGRRAQHRRHAARLDGRQALPPRPRRQRSAPSHGERLRADLRLARVQLRQASRSSTRSRTSPPPSRRRCAIRRCRSTSAPATPPASIPRMPSPYWGERAHLGDARQQPQLDVRPRRPALAGRVGARRRQPGVVQGRLRPSRRPRRSRWSAPCATWRC